MPAPQKIYDQLTSRLIVASSRDDKELVDKLLDVWWDVTYRATDWDAAFWGFDAELWYREERYMLISRATRDQQNK